MDGGSYEDFRGYVATLWGEMGELRVAVRESGLLDRGLRVSDLGRLFGTGRAADVARRELSDLAYANGQIFQKELDLLFDKGATWGEVKYFNEPLKVGDFHWDRVTAQIEKAKRLKEILEDSPRIRAAIGKRIKMRIYLVSGVTPEAAAELEKLGVEVIGERITITSGLWFSLLADWLAA
jgi:hypothetical protein